MRRWSHGHSLGVGALLTVSLASRHLLVGALLVFIAGVLVGRLWSFWAFYAGALRGKVLHARRARIATAPTAVYSTTGRRRGPTDEVPY